MDGPSGPCSLLIIFVTGVVSFLGFRNRDLQEKCLFDPQAILAGKEYHRLLTSAFQHSGWQHLLLNMFSLYLFGGAVELLLGEAHFLAIYFGAVMGGSLLSLYIHRHHEYRAYGASGGVCGVIFAYILLFPGANILVFPLPIGIPAWLYAIGYLAGSFCGMRTGIGNVGHDAHLGGAIIGLLIAAGLHPSSVRINLTMFLIVLVAAVLLLIYLWANPLHLEHSSLFARTFRPAGLRPKPRQIQEPDPTIDDLLEKVSKHGIHSLTKEEHALLAEASESARRRAETKKPESDLVI